MLMPRRLPFPEWKSTYKGARILLLALISAGATAFPAQGGWGTGQALAKGPVLLPWAQPHPSRTAGHEDA